jgi:intein-encoded DNA endonuclease-like protein
VKKSFLIVLRYFLLFILAQPIFTNDNILTQYGEFGGKAVITVYVYSVPKYSISRWHKSNTQVPPSTKYVMSERPAIVNNIFHGKTIQLDGYSVMLTINELKESDFNAMYTLKLSYGASQTVQYSVSLKSGGK